MPLLLTELVTNMMSIHNRHLDVKSATNAKPRFRKSALFWWLIVAGIFLVGMMIGRTAKYAPQTRSALEIPTMVGSSR
jgi:hypothetical protein